MMAMIFKISKLRKVRVRLLIIMVFLILYVITSYIVVDNYVFKSKDDAKIRPSVKLEYIVVHLDLKGAPPKLAYLKSILPMLKKHGVNGLLIEYEDMFPYEGRLKKLRAVHCYKKKELHAYLTAAVSYGFEIIPLVQTFGHLEFVLKQKTFAHLRENPEFHDAICPSSLESRKFLHNMLQQVIDFHKRIAPLKHIHVGCDEVFHLNNCSLCLKRNLNRAQALSSHIDFVINTVHSLSPDSIVLIWDDMYRDVKPIQTTRIKFNKAEVVYWDYTPTLNEVTHANMYKYNQMFDNLWVATAFKGADALSHILPNLKSRFYNHLSWLNFIFHYNTMRNFYRFKGIILTGWSRYKHTDPMCELFPASIHSLILNLILIEQYRKGIVVEDLMHVNDFINQHIRSKLAYSLHCQKLGRFLESFDGHSCIYDEADLYVVLQNLNNKTSVIKYILAENAFKYVHDTSTNNVQFKAEYEYVNRIQAHIKLCLKFFHELPSIKDQVIALLSDYFEPYVIEEYVGTRIHNLNKSITNMIALRNYKDYIHGLLKGESTSFQNRTKTRN